MSRTVARRSDNYRVLRVFGMRTLLQTDADVPSAVDRFFKSGCHGYPCFPYFLAGLYTLIGAATLIQLMRIHSATPIRRWTMQKAFQALNVGICIFRAGSLFAYPCLHEAAKTGLVVSVIDFTSLLFCTTYLMLVLFWADIIHTTMDSKGPCPPLMTYVTLNLAGYVSAALFWSLCAERVTLTAGRRASAVLVAGFDATAAFGFGHYGRKLLKLLTMSTVRSATLMNKVIDAMIDVTEDDVQIREVSLVAVFSVIGFCLKSAIEIMSTTKEVGLTYGPNGFLDVMFYAFTEILVMGSVLALLSRLPRAPQTNDRYGTEGPSTRFYDPYHDVTHETPLIPHHHPSTV